MEPYISYEQYAALYGPPAIGEAEFPIYAAQATALIDAVTQFRIPQGGGLSALPQWEQDLVTRAVGAQILYLDTLGLDTVLTGQTGQSFTVGKVSVNGGGLASGGKSAAQLMVSPMAVALLEQTQLMERRCQVCSPQYLLPFWGI